MRITVRRRFAYGSFHMRPIIFFRFYSGSPRAVSVDLSSIMCFTAGAVKWRLYCFATILLLHATLEISSVPCYLSRWRFILANLYLGRSQVSSCCFGSLPFNSSILLHRGNSQLIEDSRLESRVHCPHL